MNKNAQQESHLDRYYTAHLTLLQLMGVLALLGISLTWLLHYFL